MVDCQKTDSPPNPVEPDPDDGLLLGWDEVQNLTLDEDLPVDRVADPSADFIGGDASSGFSIEAGTVVSSHYLQWDPDGGSRGTVDGRIAFDSEIFAFITATNRLFDTDDLLGLPELDYNDFGFRGLESGDITEFDGRFVDIDWTASSPGDWTRLLTAFSPTAEEDEPTPVPAPGSLALLGLGLSVLAMTRARRRRHR